MPGFLLLLLPSTLPDFALSKSVLVHKLRGESGTKNHQINKSVEMPTLSVSPVTVAM